MSPWIANENEPIQYLNPGQIFLEKQKTQN